MTLRGLSTTIAAVLEGLVRFRVVLGGRVLLLGIGDGRALDLVVSIVVAGVLLYLL